MATYPHPWGLTLHPVLKKIFWRYLAVWCDSWYFLTLKSYPQGEGLAFYFWERDNGIIDLKVGCSGLQSKLFTEQKYDL
ncbi:MAG: hypothetical protein ABIJ84_02260 [bacterium]